VEWKWWVEEFGAGKFVMVVKAPNRAWMRENASGVAENSARWLLWNSRQHLKKVKAFLDLDGYYQAAIKATTQAISSESPPLSLLFLVKNQDTLASKIPLANAVASRQ
jgi:hypothetical protein